VAYEIKAILIALDCIIRETRDIRKVHEVIRKMANTEGVIIQPLDPEADNGKAPKA